MARACGGVWTATSLVGLPPADAPTGQHDGAAPSAKRTRADHSFCALVVWLLDGDAPGRSAVRHPFVPLRFSLAIAACRSRRNSASFVLRARLVAFTTVWYAASSSETEKGWG